MSQRHTEGRTNPAPSPGAQGGLPSLKIKVTRKQITLEAIELARSTDPIKHEHLRALLTDEDYLLKLNSPDQYLKLPPENLQLHFILDALTESSGNLALQTLDFLAGNKLYQQLGPRQDLLLTASGKIGEPPANIIKLWKRQLDPEGDGELNLTVEMIVTNGSPAAISILEEALLRNDYEPDYVIGWLRRVVLAHRQDLPLLGACERLLQAKKWPGECKVVLVEVLYDYRPEQWYRWGGKPPRPPSRKTLSAPARRKLLEIADLALRQGFLDKARHAQIRAELTAK